MHVSAHDGAVYSVAAKDVLEGAVNITSDERVYIRNAMRNGWPNSEQVALVTIVNQVDEEDSAALVLRLTPSHRFFDIRVHFFPYPFVDACGCLPVCAMPTKAALVEGGQTCWSATWALNVYHSHQQEDLYWIERYGSFRGRKLAYCEMLFEDAITKAVAIQLPVEGVPEMVAKYALWVFQRMGTVYE